MMVVLEISDIESWKNFFDMVFDTSSNICMKFDENKCKMTLLSKSHIAFYDAEYTNEFFDSYDVDGLEIIVVDVEDLYKILKSANKKDIMIMESDESFLKIVFEHDGNRRVFELPLQEYYDDTPPLPIIDFEAEFELALNDLKSPIEDLDKIVKTNKFTILTQSDECWIVSPIDSLTKYKQIIDIDEVVSSIVVVDLEYIKQVLRLTKIDKYVKLFIGEDIPLKWVITSPLDDVCITGLIAPIVEEEE